MFRIYKNRTSLTVSTQRSISRKNFDEAPNARKMVAPAIVSPYIEYIGERVTESVRESFDYDSDS